MVISNSIAENDLVKFRIGAINNSVTQKKKELYKF